jgi:hypothetical protein
VQELQSQPRRTFEDYCLIREVASSRETTIADPPLTPGSTDDPTVATQNSDVTHSTVTPAPELVGACGTSLLTRDSQLTEEQAFEALKEFRDTVIRPQSAAWEPHRSILRDGMIETFVRQRVTDPEDWFRKVPQYQRSATNPVEKRLFLSQICEIVERIADSNSFKLTSPVTLPPPEREHNPSEPSTNAAPAAGATQSDPAAYVIADMGTLGATPRGDLFYEPRYRALLCQMVARVIEVEGPIYGDVLVTRIARAHGFQRSGSNIHALVLAAVDRRFPRTKEDGREVFWKEGARTDIPVLYRSSSKDIRSHADIPIIELAGLAGSYARLRMKDEEILKRMADQFELGRLRDATRARFQRAITLARSTLDGNHLGPSEQT